MTSRIVTNVPLSRLGGYSRTLRRAKRVVSQFERLRLKDD